MSKVTVKEASAIINKVGAKYMKDHELDENSEMVAEAISMALKALNAESTSAQKHKKKGSIYHEDRRVHQTAYLHQLL